MDCVPAAKEQGRGIALGALGTEEDRGGGGGGVSILDNVAQGRQRRRRNRQRNGGEEMSVGSTRGPTGGP